MLCSLLDKQKDLDVYRKCNDTYSARLKKANKHKKFFCVMMALDFLSYKDRPLDLLYVNKQWRTGLRKKVYKMILAVPDEVMTVRTRLNLWKSIIQLVILAVITSLTA